VERNTSVEGNVRHFSPKSRQARGNAGSQVILKCLHKKQFGGLLGIFASGLRELFVIGIELILPGQALRFKFIASALLPRCLTFFL